MNLSGRLNHYFDVARSVYFRIFRLWDSNYFYAAGIKIITAVQFMLIAKLVSVEFSLSDAGNFFLMYNAGLLVSALFFSTHSSGLLRYYSVFSDKATLFKTILDQLGVILIVLSVIAILVFYSFGETIQYAVTIAYAGCIGMLLMLMTKFRVAGQFKHCFCLLVFQSVVLTSLILICVFNKSLSPSSIIVCLCVSILLSVAVYAVSRADSLSSIIQKKVMDKKIRKSLCFYGFPFIVVAVANLLISTNGQFMLKHLGYSDEVGVYAANYNIGEKSVFLWLSLVIMVNVPKIYHAYEENGVFSALNIIKNCMAILIFLGGLLFVFTVFWSRELSTLLLSGEMSRLGHWIIPYTVISAILLGLCSLLVEALLIEKKSVIVAFCYLVSAIFSGVSAYLWIDRYGLVGAVLSPIFSNTLFLLLLIVFIKRNSRYNFDAG